MREFTNGRYNEYRTMQISHLKQLEKMQEFPPFDLINMLQNHRLTHRTMLNPCAFKILYKDAQICQGNEEQKSG